VTGGVTGATKKKLFTFGGKKFVPVTSQSQKRLPFPKTYSKKDTRTHHGTTTQPTQKAPLQETSHDSIFTITPASNNTEHVVTNTVITPETTLNINNIGLDTTTSHVDDVDFGYVELDSLVKADPMLGFHDEGYNTGSCGSGRSSPACSIEVVTDNSISTELGIQGINLETIMTEAEGLEFTLLDSDNIEETNIFDEELAIPPQLDNPSTTYVGTFENMADIMKAFSVKPPNSKQKVKKHNLSRKQKPLKNILPENLDNVMRCREYRKKKNIKLADHLDELESLGTRNDELKEKERRMSEKLAQAKAVYLRLIKKGTVKYCVQE